MYVFSHYLGGFTMGLSRPEDCIMQALNISRLYEVQEALENNPPEIIRETLFINLNGLLNTCEEDAKINGAISSYLRDLLDYFIEASNNSDERLRFKTVFQDIVRNIFTEKIKYEEQQLKNNSIPPNEIAALQEHFSKLRLQYDAVMVAVDMYCRNKPLRSVNSQLNQAIKDSSVALAQAAAGPAASGVGGIVDVGINLISKIKTVSDQKRMIELETPVKDDKQSFANKTWNWIKKNVAEAVEWVKKNKIKAAIGIVAALSVAAVATFFFPITLVLTVIGAGIAVGTAAYNGWKITSMLRSSMKRLDEFDARTKRYQEELKQGSTEEFNRDMHHALQQERGVHLLNTRSFSHVGNTAEIARELSHDAKSAKALDAAFGKVATEDEKEKVEQHYDASALNQELRKMAGVSHLGITEDSESEGEGESKSEDDSDSDGSRFSPK